MSVRQEVSEKMKWVLLVFCSFLGCVQASVYIGADGANWNEEGNWNPVGVPSSAATICNSLTVTVNDTVENHPAGIFVGNKTPGKLILDSGAVLTSDGNVAVGVPPFNGSANEMSELTVNNGTLATSSNYCMTIGAAEAGGILNVKGGILSIGGTLSIGQANVNGYGNGVINILGGKGELIVGGVFQINQKGSILWKFEGGKTLSTISVAGFLSRSPDSIGTLNVDFSEFSGPVGEYTITLFAVACGTSSGSKIKDALVAINTQGKVADVAFSSTYTSKGLPMTINMTFKGIETR